jgi:hypothetical protein
MRWPSGDHPGAGGKERGVTGPSSSTQTTVEPGGGSVGQCRARLSSIFWDELRVRTLGPRSRPAPAHTFSEQDAPHLAAAYLDAYLVGGFGERVQRPVRSLRLVFGLESASGLGEQLARRIFGDQGDDPGALVLCDAGLTARAGAVSEPVYTFGVPSALKRWRRFLTVFG